MRVQRVLTGSVFQLKRRCGEAAKKSPGKKRHAKDICPTPQQVFFFQSMVKAVMGISGRGFLSGGRSSRRPCCVSLSKAPEELEMVITVLFPRQRQTEKLPACQLGSKLQKAACTVGSVFFRGRQNDHRLLGEGVKCFLLLRSCPRGVQEREEGGGRRHAKFTSYIIMRGREGGRLQVVAGMAPGWPW